MRNHPQAAIAVFPLLGTQLLEQALLYLHVPQEDFNLIGACELAKCYIGAQSVVRQVHADLLLVAAAAIGVAPQRLRPVPCLGSPFEPLQSFKGR